MFWIGFFAGLVAVGVVYAACNWRVLMFRLSGGFRV